MLIVGGSEHRRWGTLQCEDMSSGGGDSEWRLIGWQCSEHRGWGQNTEWGTQNAGGREAHSEGGGGSKHGGGV